MTPCKACGKPSTTLVTDRVLHVTHYPGWGPETHGHDRDTAYCDDHKRPAMTIKNVRRFDDRADSDD